MNINFDLFDTCILEGWDKAFGDRARNMIKEEVAERGFDDFEFLDVKEKFGTLRIYANYDLDCFDKIEDLSGMYCWHCGAKMKVWSRGYMLPYCGDCAYDYMRKAKKHIPELEFEDCFRIPGGQ